MVFIPQLEKATATDRALTIALEDLDEEIRNVFNDVYKEVREQRPQPDTLQLFEFEVEDPPFSPTVQDLFEEAARLRMSSYRAIARTVVWRRKSMPHL